MFLKTAASAAGESKIINLDNVAGIIARWIDNSGKGNYQVIASTGAVGGGDDVFTLTGSMPKTEAVRIIDAIWEAVKANVRFFDLADLASKREP